MKKKIVVSVAALLLVGARTIYAFSSGAIQFGTPTQEDLDMAVSQAAESAAQQTVEVFAQSSAAQDKELEELRQQVEQLNGALAEAEDTATTPPTSEMQVVQVSLPAPTKSKPIAVPVSQTPSFAPPVVPAPAKQENAGTVFEGYTVMITDKKAPAVRAAGTDWPITTYYFISASGDRLGSITGTAMNGIIKKYEATLGANEEWEFWFAEQFNSYRGLSGSVVGGNSSSTPQLVSPSSRDIDIDIYADEVITLINQKRQNKGLNMLDIDDSLMSHSAIRAEELSLQYSHVRPDGTKEKSECIVMRRDTPTAAVQAWMDSDPHRDAILNESGRFNYSSIGAGCYQDEAGVLYWVITFGESGGNGQDANQHNADSESTSNMDKPAAKFSISESELYLTAGDGHQLSIDSTGSDAFTVSWSGPSIGKNTLSIDDSGYITTFYRNGTDTAKATLTVTAKVSVNGKIVKTLNCKVTVTQ